MLDGIWYTDEEFEARIRDAVKQSERVDYQPMEQALEAQGFNKQGLGMEESNVPESIHVSHAPRNVCMCFRSHTCSSQTSQQ